MALAALYEDYFEDFEQLMNEVAFDEGPQSSYVVRNRPAILTCKAWNAEKIRFKCNDKWIADDRVEVQTGVSEDQRLFRRVIVELSRQEVEEGLAESDSFSCQCLASRSTDSFDSDAVRSETAVVKVAYLRKHFYQTPESDRVPEGRTIQLPCVPPDGDPRVEVFWLKDGHELGADSDSNLILANDGSLIISATRIGDSGNYSCEARNLVNRRATELAEIVVYVDGNWSSWSGWQGVCAVDCAFLHTHIDMNRGDEHALRQVIPSQRRTRQCNNPAPLNGGSRCAGPEEEFRPCVHECKVDGSWTKWAAWSECSSSCHRIRTRQCMAPEPQNGGLGCVGRQSESVNCTEGVLPLHCRPGHGFYPGATQNDNNRDLNMAPAGDLWNGSQLYIMGSLFCFTFLILVIIALIVTLLCKRKKSEKDQVYFPNGSVHTVLLQQQKAALLSQLGSRDVQLMCTPPPAPYMHMGTVSTNHCPNSYTMKSNKSYASGYSTTHRLGGSRAALITNDYSSSSSGCSSSGVAKRLLPRMHGPSPTQDYATLYDIVNDKYDKYPPVYDPPHDPAEPNPNLDKGATIVAAQVDQELSRIELKKCGAAVSLSENTFVDSTMVFMAVSDDLHDRPSLSSGETWLSSVVEFGRCETEDLDVQPAKPVVISLEHFASTFPKDNWVFLLYADLGQGWEQVIRLGEENLNTPTFVHLERRRAHIMSDQFGRFVLAGVPRRANVPALKRVKAMAYASPPVKSVGDTLSVRVYIVPDTTMAMENVKTQESQQSGSLITEPVEFLMAESGPLCLNIDEDRPNYDGYTLPHSGAKNIEIPETAHKWCAQNGIHCTFSLVMTSDNVDKLTGRISISQRGSLAEKQQLLFDLNPTRPQRIPFETSSDRIVSQDFKLIPEVKLSLAHLLDQPVDSEQDWRGLAKKLGFDRYLQYFGTRPGCSPTALILDLWEATVLRSDRAVFDLLQCLRVMGRPDAAAVLEACIPSS